MTFVMVILRSQVSLYNVFRRENFHSKRTINRRANCMNEDGECYYYIRRRYQHWMRYVAIDPPIEKVISIISLLWNSKLYVRILLPPAPGLQNPSSHPLGLQWHQRYPGSIGRHHPSASKLCAGAQRRPGGLLTGFNSAQWTCNSKGNVDAHSFFVVLVYPSLQKQRPYRQHRHRGDDSDGHRNGRAR